MFGVLFGNKKIEEVVKNEAISMVLIGAFIGFFAGFFLKESFDSSWWVVIFTTLIGYSIGSIPAMYIYAFGEVIELLREQNRKTDEIYKQMPKAVADEKSKESAPPRVVTPKVSAASLGTWACKNCNEKNEAGARFCRSCGTYK